MNMYNIYCILFYFDLSFISTVKQHEQEIKFLEQLIINLESYLG